MRRFARFAVAVVGVAVLSGVTPAGAQEPPDGGSPALCGREDNPETGIQGDVPLADQQSGRAEQGYNCGLAVVGYNDLGGQGGGDLAWSGHCGYVRSPGGIKVIDVSNPFDPTVVGLLPINVTSENIHAATTDERALLVAAGSGRPPQVHVWDVRDCTHPILLDTVGFPGLSPGNPAVVTMVHNIELTPDGTKVWGSLPLQVADITNLADPSTWTVRQVQCEIAAQTFPGFQGIGIFPQTAFALDHPECGNILAHEFEFNAASTRMYIGGQLSDWLAEQRTPGIDWHTEQVLRVVDISVDPPQILGEVEPAAGHGVRRATIGGKPYLLHSNENVNPDSSTVNGCSPFPGDTGLPVFGAAHGFLTDITDETAPQVVAELELAINDEANCAAQLESRVRATIHWNDVNDPDDTTFAMLPMGNAGLRLFDVRDPEAPIEVAYFNPGMFGTALDRAATCGVEPEASGNGNVSTPCEIGQIWLTTRVGGFWVLELEPQVRKALGLPHNRYASEFPDGRPARPPDL